MYLKQFQDFAVLKAKKAHGREPPHPLLPEIIFDEGVYTILGGQRHLSFPNTRLIRRIIKQYQGAFVVYGNSEISSNAEWLSQANYGDVISWVGLEIIPKAVATVLYRFEEPQHDKLIECYRYLANNFFSLRSETYKTRQFSKDEVFLIESEALLRLATFGEIDRERKIKDEGLRAEAIAGYVSRSNKSEDALSFLNRVYISRDPDLTMADIRTSDRGLYNALAKAKSKGKINLDGIIRPGKRGAKIKDEDFEEGTPKPVSDPDLALYQRARRRLLNRNAMRSRRNSPAVD